MSQVVVHRGRELSIPWWVPSAETIAERERLLAASYFLVRISGNAGVGEVWRCKGCGAKHRYLTLRCVEQPFSGLSGGLYAYWSVMGAAGVYDWLDPSQKARYDAIERAFGPQADLASAHPRFARSMATAETDTDLGGMALGLLEPITRTKAQQLANAINMRGIKPAFRLPGLEA